MPQIAQRLREPAAFALLAYAVLSTLFRTIDFLFAPGQQCFGSVCSGPNFSIRAIGALDGLTNPVLALVLVAAVFLAHFGAPLKQAKLVALVALITAGVAALFGVVALFASFGADGYAGWSKAENFFVGVAELAVYGIATWLLLGYYQQHAPAQPKPVIGGPPPVQFQQQGQWQQAGQTQPQGPAQGQWNPPAQQQWGPPPQQPPQGQPPQGQPWGAPPPPPAPPQQQGFAAGTDSMMTQAIPAVPQQQPQPQQPPAPPAPPQAAPETQQFPPVGNWTSE